MVPSRPGEAITCRVRDWVAPPNAAPSASHHAGCAHRVDLRALTSEQLDPARSERNTETWQASQAPELILTARPYWACRLKGIPTGRGETHHLRGASTDNVLQEMGKCWDFLEKQAQYVATCGGARRQGIDASIHDIEGGWLKSSRNVAHTTVLITH